MLQDIFKDVRFLILLVLYQTVLFNIREWDIVILFGYPIPEEDAGLSLTNILLLPAWLSLVLSEVAKILILLCQKSWTWRKGPCTLKRNFQVYHMQCILFNSLTINSVNCQACHIMHGSIEDYSQCIKHPLPCICLPKGQQP